MSKGKLVFYKHNVLTQLFADTFTEPLKPWLNTGWGAWQCKRELGDTVHSYFEYGEFKDAFIHVLRHIPVKYHHVELFNFVRMRLGNLADPAKSNTDIYRSPVEGALIILDIRWSDRPYAKYRIDGEVGIIPLSEQPRYAYQLSLLAL